MKWLLYEIERRRACTTGVRKCKVQTYKVMICTIDGTKNQWLSTNDALHIYSIEYRGMIAGAV